MNQPSGEETADEDAWELRGIGIGEPSGHISIYNAYSGRNVGG